MKMIDFLKQLGIIVVVVIIGWIAAQKYYFNDWKNQLNQQQTSLLHLKQENDAADRYRIERDTLQKEIEIAKKRYHEVEVFLPSVDNFGEIFQQVKVQARLANLILENKDDTHASYKPGLNESPVALQLRGKFIDQLTFLSWVSGYSRVVVFSNQEVKNNGLDTTMTLKGFVPIDLPTQEATTVANTFSIKQ